VKHRFLAIDEGNRALLHIDENDPSRDWVVPIDKIAPRDMQLIGNDRLLIGHDGGYSEIEISNGEIVKDYSLSAGITSARRQPNGGTLLAGVGPSGANVIELDENDATVRTAVFPISYIRLMRQTMKGTYLMACDRIIAEGNELGGIIWQAKIDMFNHAWKAVKLPNGNVIASAGYGAFIAEIDEAGTVVRRLGDRDAMPPETLPCFYSTFQLLANGDIVFANWQGHGPGRGKSGVQLIELDKAGNIVWQWSDSSVISSLQGILILDGLDTQVLHDEREGVMKPQR